jgi:hypothetical protein
MSLRSAHGTAGDSLVAGTSAGEVWLWRTADRTLLVAVQAHTGPARRRTPPGPSSDDLKGRSVQECAGLTKSSASRAS